MNAELRARIAARWPSAQDFYLERDDRTLRGVADLHAHVRRPVQILIDANAVNDVTVQRIALVVANLTARWARRIRLVTPVKTSSSEWVRQITDEMEAADPFGDFAVVETAEADKAFNPLRLFVGEWREVPHGATADDFVVHAIEWTAFGRRGDEVAVGALSASPAAAAAVGLAGALGAADLFKRAICHERHQWMPTFSWDTSSFHFAIGRNALRPSSPRSVPSVLDVGKLLLAGVGAIGSSFLYLANFMDIKGTLALFDRDRVETSNLNRSPLFTVEHALERVLKTDAAKSFLYRHPAHTTTTNGVWREHAAGFGESGFDVWISLTNEDGAWAEIPFQLPPVVLQATTTSGWGFGAGRHIPRVEDCTLCRMPRPAAEFRGPCSEGEVARVNGQEIRASLPFLSTAAASLLLASVLQLQEGAPVGGSPNDVSADLSSGLPAVIALKRLTSNDCRGCKTMLRGAWMQRGGAGRFAHLSG